MLKRLELAANTNPAEALKLLPELFRAVHEGIIVELPCKVGDTVYHIDSGNQIWEFIITKISGVMAEVESKDELKCKASFNVFDMPAPRLFFSRAEAVERLESEKK